MLLGCLVRATDDLDAIERRHRQFLDNYDSYRKEYGPCDD